MPSVHPPAPHCLVSPVPWHTSLLQERSQESKLNEEDRSIFAASLIEKADVANEKSNSSLSMSSDSMTTDLKTNGNEALRALEKLDSIGHSVTARIVMSLVPSIFPLPLHALHPIHSPKALDVQ